MKQIYFVGEGLNKDEIIKDPTLKPHIVMKLSWTNGLILGFKSETTDDIESYIMLKYGDFVKDTSKLFVDRTPVPDKDYTPKRNTNKLNIMRKF